MKRIIAIIVFFAAFLFPPCDWVIPAEAPRLLGGNQFGGSPEGRYDRGFVLITNVGGHMQIRYPQWLVELVVIGAVGVVILRKKI